MVEQDRREEKQRPRVSGSAQSDVKPAPLQTQDWDALVSGEVEAATVPENGDMRYDGQNPAESLEEEDDNAYQESDEALPDDEEEAAISRRSDSGGTDDV